MEVHDNMSERNIKQRTLIVELRDKKATYSAIAKEIGISRHRVKQLYVDEKAREIKSLEWTGSLSGRAKSIIKMMGLKSNEEVLKAIRSGVLTGGSGFGYKTFYEICKYVGFDKKEGGSR